MKISFKKQLLALLALPVLALGVAAPTASALDLSVGSGANSAKGNDQTSCIFPGQDGCDGGETPLFQTITNVLLFIIGAVSVIMLIIGGFRYTVSQGDSSALTSAKNTILYSIIGIVVALLAYGIVNFVVGNFVAGE
ncbi:MAG: pilin [Candidatus Saccharimonas sp.]